MKSWQTPTLTQYGDVTGITQQSQATVKCPGAGDDLAQGIDDTNLPPGSPCS